MLDAFRTKGLSSAIYGVLISATVVIFIVQFRPNAGKAGGSIKVQCAAEIRGTCIEPKDYFAELMLVAPGQALEAAQIRALGLRKIVLDGVVERELLNQDAARLGITVSEDDVDNELVAGRAHVSLPVENARQLMYTLRIGDDMVTQLPVKNADKAFDYKVYDRVIRQHTNRSPTEFKEMQRQEIVASRVREIVKARVHVSDDEAFDAFSHEKSSATIRYVRMRRDWFAVHALDMSKEGIAAFTRDHQEEIDKAYEAKKAQYWPECIAARHILIKVSESATDDDKAEAHRRIDAAISRIKKGESFEQVARDVSEDSSAARGGDLGCFQKGHMVKPFEEAVLALSQGEMSNVVETQFGLHVIKLEGVYKDKDAESAGRRDTAQELMFGEEADAMASATAKKVLGEVKAGKKIDDALDEALASLEEARSKRGRGGAAKSDAAKKLSAVTGETAATEEAGAVGSLRPKVEISASFSLGGDPIPGVAPGQNVADLAFGLAGPGAAPDDLVKLTDGYAVVQLKDKEPATREQFDKERDTFVPAMVRAKQSDALLSYVGRLRDSAKGEIKLNDAYAHPPTKGPADESDSE